MNDSRSVDVKKIANLAYLQIPSDKQQAFEKSFSDIISYFDQLNEVSMTNEDAKKMGAFHILLRFYESHQQNLSQTWRSDSDSGLVETLNLTNHEALQNSPQSSGIPGELLFEVPSIIERK